MGSKLSSVVVVFLISAAVLCCVKAQSHLLISTPDSYFINDSAVSFSWEQRIESARVDVARYFEIEIAVGLHSNDFVSFATLPVEVPIDFSNNTFYTSFTAGGLLPEANYRFRVVPILSTGRGLPSFPTNVTTLQRSINFWEPVLGRRLALSSSARGFTNDVLDRPHLDTGVESWDARVSNNALRYSDPTTSETPVLPSGRRGHTISTILDKMYMFGGRTNGYSCSNVYKDLFNLGNIESGRYMYPCIYKQGEVSELWSFDLNTYQWVYLNVSKWDSVQPPSREQHSSVVVDGDLFVFGGKARFFSTDSETGDIITSQHSDVVYSDMWKLVVPRPLLYILEPSHLNVTSGGALALIPQTSRHLNMVRGLDSPEIMAVSDEKDPRSSYCIDKVTIKVTVTHQCLSQLYLSIKGPDSSTGSPNFFTSSYDNEIILFRNVPTDGSGCVSGTHTFIFDDDATRIPEQCCVNRDDISGAYKPQGRLGEFIGSTMAANWTLVVQDLKLDTLEGTLDSWEINFVSSPCMSAYTWENVTDDTYVDGSSPIARYGAFAMQHNQYIFVHGGRDKNDNFLSDLQRYDTVYRTWKTLTPVNFDVALTPSSAVKNNMLLTSWGLIRFGGYFRQPTMSLTPDSLGYDNTVFVLDPVSMKWSMVEAEMTPHKDLTFGRQIPPYRYLSASTFVPAGALTWVSKLGHSALYTDAEKSTRSNYQGTISDTLLIFGGFDGSTGSVYDGSSGGFFNDMWMLRLSKWSTAGARVRQEEYIDKHCAWRTGLTAVSGGGGIEGELLGTYSCLDESGKCDFRDLLLLSWCSRQNQTVA